MLRDEVIEPYDNVAGNYYDKYGTQNPVARRLMAGFLAAFDELCARTGASTVLEVGCGEGHLSLRLMARGLAVRGFDIGEDVVARANLAAETSGYGRPFFTDSIYDLRPDGMRSDLVICCEVLEHLPSTAIALDRLAAVAGSHVLVSVPREPLWRVLNMMRGKYIGSLGNTPGHIQHWTSGGFVALLRSRFDIVEIRRPLPWTMVLCKVRG